MVRLPARFLAVFALAGLVLGVLSMTKIGSTPAQDVAPPGASSPPFEGGVPDGIPGCSPASDGSSGSDGSNGSDGSVGSPGSSGSGGSSSSDGNAGSGVSSGPDGTVSSVVNPNEPAYEWTLERMLLATPMPMTQEERDFLHKHASLEKIREWSQEQFGAYVASEFGLRQASQEGFRWRGLVSMLKKQQTAAIKFLKKKPSKKDPVLPESVAGPLDTADAEQFEKAFRQDTKAAYVKLKQWRQEIAVLASSVESMRKEAEKRGQAERFNEVLSAEEQ